MVFTKVNAKRCFQYNEHLYYYGFICFSHRTCKDLYRLQRILQKSEKQFSRNGRSLLSDQKLTNPSSSLVLCFSHLWAIMSDSQQKLLVIFSMHSIVCQLTVKKEPNHYE
jgi:hypothetical protein